MIRAEHVQPPGYRAIPIPRTPEAEPNPDPYRQGWRHGYAAARRGQPPVASVAPTRYMAGYADGYRDGAHVTAAIGQA